MTDTLFCYCELHLMARESQHNLGSLCIFLAERIKLRFFYVYLFSLPILHSPPQLV